MVDEATDGPVDVGADQPAAPPVVLPGSAVASDDLEDAIYGLIDVVNSMYAALLTDAEIGEDMLTHYYVDFYLAEVANGGHSQFLFNMARGDATRTMRLVKRGLRELAVGRTLEVFEEFENRVLAIPGDELAHFLTDGYVDQDGFHPLHQLDELDDLLYPDSDTLMEANARWLLGRANLLVIPDDELPGYLVERQAEFPDLPERRAAARASEPSYLTAARDYCDRHGLTFDTMTAGEPVERDGLTLIRWHFLTADEHYALVELPDGQVEVDRVGARSS